MSMTDPIADFLTRLRNGIQARKEHVKCPRSSVKLRIAEILKDEGYLDGVVTGDDALQGSIEMTLRYNNAMSNAISGLQRVSRPGQRRYVGVRELPRVRNGLGIAILSTSRGVMTDRKARELGIGGEVLCEVW